MESEMVEVEVEFDYEAELSDELTIKAGETIKEVKKMDGGWWEGTLNGRRGVFPDNFVKVINRETPKTKPLTAPPPVNIANEEPVQLRRGQQSRVSATSSSSNKKKQCRVLFSYQPQHEDELELKMEDVVDFVAEVEDGWWKGKLRGRVGVFPSNFVEMIKNHANNEDAEQTVQDKNKRNEKLKSVERTQRPPSSKISNLIHDAESKGKKKSSMENLSLVKRESPLGGEDNSVIAKSDDLSNAPKLPPKPGTPNDSNNNCSKKPRFTLNPNLLLPRRTRNAPTGNPFSFRLFGRSRKTRRILHGLNLSHQIRREC